MRKGVVRVLGGVVFVGLAALLGCAPEVTNRRHPAHSGARPVGVVPAVASSAAPSPAPDSPGAELPPNLIEVILTNDALRVAGQELPPRFDHAELPKRLSDLKLSESLTSAGYVLNVADDTEVPRFRNFVNYVWFVGWGPAHWRVGNAVVRLAHTVARPEHDVTTIMLLLRLGAVEVWTGPSERQIDPESDVYSEFPPPATRIATVPVPEISSRLAAEVSRACQKGCQSGWVAVADAERLATFKHMLATAYTSNAMPRNGLSFGWMDPGPASIQPRTDLVSQTVIKAGEVTRSIMEAPIKSVQLGVPKASAKLDVTALRRTMRTMLPRLASCSVFPMFPGDPPTTVLLEFDLGNGAGASNVRMTPVGARNNGLPWLSLVAPCIKKALADLEPPPVQPKRVHVTYPVTFF